MNETTHKECLAVIFTAQRRDEDITNEAYARMASDMESLAATMPGFLGIEHARNPDGFGITISYWDSEDAIKNWKTNHEHAIARNEGRAQWYSAYKVKVARIERAYDWTL